MNGTWRHNLSRTALANHDEPAIVTFLE